MTPAATVLTEPPTQTVTPAAGVAASAQSPSITFFSSLLAQGNSAQRGAGMIPTGSREKQIPAALLSIGEGGAKGKIDVAMDGEEASLDSALTVIPLFDAASPSRTAPTHRSLNFGFKAVTTADTPAEITPFNFHGTGLIGAAAKTTAVTSRDKQAPTPGPNTVPPLTTGAIFQPLSQQVSATAEPLSAPIVISTIVGAAAASTSEGGAGREGGAPDPRIAGQIVQSAVPRPSARIRATIKKAGVGLSPALGGDVAPAAMATETPKPGIIGPNPDTDQDASKTMMRLNSAADDGKSPSESSTRRQSQPLTNRGGTPPTPFGQALKPASLGAAPGLRMTETSDIQAAPRGAAETRIDASHPAAQLARGSDAAARSDRPTTVPTASFAPPVEQVALRLRHAAAKGIDKITIQLNPASLGSIDVILEVSAGARISVHVIADRAATIELLRSDSRGLERALQEAGLRTDSNSLNFNLRGEGEGAAHKNSAPFKDFDESGTNDNTKPGGDSETGGTGVSPENQARQASDTTLDIEV